MHRTINIADLFCGAGGTSTGAMEACHEAGFAPRLTAINHWDLAISTHTANHPAARHLCANLDSINPRDLFKEGELDILWASPECTDHSNAKGGKPIREQSRATAHCVTRWAEALHPDIILVENVREFLDWGPCLRKRVKGQLIWAKDPQRKGETFRAWVKLLESLDYRVEWRVLCAADYGDPTTRRRLFIQAVRRGSRKKIIWPEPTHAPMEEKDLFGQTRKAWVPAKEIIDWTRPGSSIFKRKKPLADKTLQRIFIGLQKFGLKPFVCGAGGPARSGEPVTLEKPFGTVLCRENRHLIQPFLVHLRGTQDSQVKGSSKSIEQPIPALTAGGGHLGLVEPFLVQTAHGQSANGDAGRVRPITKPMPTVAGNRGDMALIQPFILAIDHTGGNGNQVRSAESPLTTVTTELRHAVIQPYIVKYFGNSDVASISEPLDTVTSKPRFGLVQPVLEIDGNKYLLEILFRMLNEREIARAQGFPDSYQFSGNKSDVVKQIGNAVPRHLAKALVRAAVTQTP